MLFFSNIDKPNSKHKLIVFELLNLFTKNYNS
jgi:hypothetical protein